MTEKIQTPELDKMSTVRNESQVIGEFIDWLSTQKMWIGEFVDLGYRYPLGMPVGMSIEQILADFFDIDLKKVEQERRAILKNIQENQS